MKTNHTNNTPKGMPPAQPDPGSYSWKLLLIKDARVHYVVLKQQPRTTHPTHPKRVRVRCSRETRNKKSHTPHPLPSQERSPGHGPVVSGPNSVPNTKPRTSRPRRSRTHPLKKGRASVLGTDKTMRPLFADIPPVSTRRRTCVCATGVLLTTPPHRHNARQGCCRCSLERR